MITAEHTSINKVQYFNGLNEKEQDTQDTMPAFTPTTSSLVTESNVMTQETVGKPFVKSPRMTCREVNVWYDDKQAIMDVNIDIGKNQVLAMIGPSGCGKSTFLRCLNRMNDTVPICRVDGEIILDGLDIYDKKIDVVPLRAKVGMVFQKPNPFPKSI